MSIEWTSSSFGLPREGEPVEFVLDGRDVTLAGTYVQQIFKSRWTAYGVDRVRAWRSSEPSAQAIPFRARGVRAVRADHAGLHAACGL